MNKAVKGSRQGHFNTLEAKQADLDALALQIHHKGMRGQHECEGYCRSVRKWPVNHCVLQYGLCKMLSNVQKRGSELFQSDLKCLFFFFTCKPATFNEKLNGLP